MSDWIIGIDLGTSTTEAAVYRNGKVEMIPNRDGKIVTPSAVGLDENGVLILGERARSQYMVHPERTAIEIKRKFGTGEKIALGTKQYTAAELSAVLLSYVRDCASAWLGEEITRAVISVPAYFDDIKRQEVVQAGKQAGFTVERIINEPTAAALSYGMDHLEEESQVLVYDLGGGTFDVTLLEMFDGVLEVKASSGDNELGGKDFDDCLLRLLQRRFEEQNQISVQKDVHAMARLKDAAEACKKALSAEESYTVQIPFFAEKDGLPLALEETVTRDEFERLAQTLVRRTHRPVETVLSDAKTSREDLSRVLLVGGSTRIPMVRRDLARLLGQEPSDVVNPDYSVAQGAAIQAAIISGAISPDQGLIMTDVAPYSLGVRVTDGVSNDCMSIVIPRNTTIPVTRKEKYYTAADGQTSAIIRIYQGERKTASENHFLGEFEMFGIPANRAHRESLDVSFSYDLNGMLQVKAVITSTGKEGRISINMMESGREKRIDVSGWKEASLAGDFRAVIRRGERLLKKLTAHPADEEEKEDAGELEELLYQIKKAILENEEEDAGDLEEAIEELLEFY